MELDVAYAGWGTAADLADRDLRGKAAFIYTMPLSGTVRHSAALNGALARVEERGAAAIFLVIEIPGNMRHSLTPTGTSVPTFALGSDDGAAVRRLIEAAPAGQTPRVRLRLDVEIVSGLTSANVLGEIPAGEGNAEEVVVVAHRDAFFEGASDNATGVATAIGLAEFFAQVPPRERRRTIKIIGTPGHHHGQDVGPEWLLENAATVLGNAALLINAEHTAYTMVDRWGPDLVPTNALGPFTWTVNGSHEMVQIANRAFDAFGIPRWLQPGGPTGEFSRVRNSVPSLGLMHAAVLLHTDAETSATILAPGLAAVTRAYAKIIDEVNDLELRELVPPDPPR